MDYNNLKNAIKGSNLTIRECASKVGMSETGFHQSIQRGTMTISVYEKICELLGVSPSSFFDDASSVTVSGNQNQIGGIGNGNRIVFTSPEVKALKQRIKDLEKIIDSQEKMIELLTNKK